jgi:hypothetical protein
VQELAINIADAREWFPHTKETPYILVQVNPEHASTWAVALRGAVRRCYLTDDFLERRAGELEKQLPGTNAFCQAQVIASKLPDAGATMSGDFGEILTYIYQSAQAYPNIAFGPKKWRLKQDRTKPAPYSDVIHFVLPQWPQPSDRDELLCAEVKTKATDGASEPIQDAIADCGKDRTSRLAKTLLWLKARAVGESLGNVEIAHLDRFINSIDHPPATKRFRAVAVICAGLIDEELKKAPLQTSADYTLVVIVVPGLYEAYTAVYRAARSSTLPEGQRP